MRYDAHLSLVAIAHARRFHPWVVRKRDVDGPSLGGRHRLQGHRAPLTGDAIRHPQGQVAQHPIAALAVLLNVQQDPTARGVAGLSVEHEVHDELQRSQGLAPPPDEEPRVVSRDFDEGSIGGVRRGLADGRDGVHRHPLQNTVHNALGGLSQRPARGQTSHPYASHLRPEAEEAALAEAKDLDFDLPPVCVELS